MLFATTDFEHIVGVKTPKLLRKRKEKHITRELIQNDADSAGGGI